MAGLMNKENIKCSIRLYSKVNKQKEKKVLDPFKIFKSREINLLFIYFFLFFLSLIQGGLNFKICRKERIEYPIISLANEITIKINGTGTLNMVYEHYEPSPNETYLNNKLYIKNYRKINR